MPDHDAAANEPARSAAEATRAYEEAVEAASPMIELLLFVAGSSPHSVRAIRNARGLCEQHLGGRYSLEIIDVHQQPGRLVEGDIVAVPTLIKRSPPPPQQFVGDLSNPEKFLAAIGVPARRGGP